MNLYRIIELHGAPKETWTCTRAFAAAENDEEVYDLLAGTAPAGLWKTGDRWPICGRWKDREEDEEVFNVYDEDCAVVGKETFRERIIRIRGDAHDDLDRSDAYYGITAHGWEIAGEATEERTRVLRELGMLLEGPVEKRLTGSAP
jgi:hypothetical protein